MSLTTLSNGDLVSSSYQEIKIWNPEDGTLKRTLTGLSYEVGILATLLNGDLASGSSDGVIKVWNTNGIVIGWVSAIYGYPAYFNMFQHVLT